MEFGKTQKNMDSAECNWKPIKSSGRPRIETDEMAMLVCYQNGMSIAEIARIYGCSESTVRRRVKKKCE